MTELESSSIEAVRQWLKVNDLKPWQKKMWCIPAVDAEFVARMEHILDLYSEPPDPKRPIVDFFDRHRRWRRPKPTKHKGLRDFAECMRDLVDEHYPGADMIRVVLDNLNTHGPRTLYKVFEPAEARCVLSRLEFRHTPKHAR